MRRIFISYRRSDSDSQTGRIFDYLQYHLGAQSVFRDVDSIGPGEVFANVIERHLKDCDTVLVIIGPSWLDAKDDETGRRRLDDPNDWVRLEIATALKLADKRRMRVIPVFVNDAKVPNEGELPAEISGLLKRQAWQIRKDPGFQADVQKLLQALGRKPKRERSKKATLIGIIFATTITIIAGRYIYLDIIGNLPFQGQIKPIVNNSETTNASATATDLAQRLVAAEATAGAIAIAEVQSQEQLQATATAETRNPTEARAEKTAKTRDAIPTSLSTPTIPFAIDELLRRYAEAQTATPVSPSLSNASGRTQSITLDHNVRVGLEPGMNIRVDYLLNNADGATCMVSAFFFDSLGRQLLDFDSFYSDDNGYVTVYEMMTPYGGNTSWTTTLPIPYSQLHMAAGFHSLQVQAGVVCINPVILTLPLREEFTLTQQ